MCCCVAATGNRQCTGMQHALSTVYKKITEYTKIFLEVEAIFSFNKRRYKKIEYKKTVTALLKTGAEASRRPSGLSINLSYIVREKYIV